MKLNKKGFAFSTMLYGSVALIAAVLYIILNINKTSVDTTYYYGEEVLKVLNDCVTEEIALENCYSGSNNPNNCNPTPYHACLGVSDTSANEKGVIISETLKDRIGKGDGIEEDPYTLGRYIYTGLNVKNYLEYSDKLWRIVSIEKDGSLLLLDTVKYSTDSWDSTSKGVWGDNSTLYMNLNNSYIATLADTSKALRHNWYVSIIYPEQSTSFFSINDLVMQEEKSNTVSAKVGLLSLSDYIKATTNAECKNDVFGQDDEITGGVITENCSSWLSEYKSWTIDINGEKGSDDEGYAFYIGDKTIIDPTTNTNRTLHNVALDKITDETLDVYPVIDLDRNSVIKGGDGTQGNPYVLK